MQICDEDDDFCGDLRIGDGGGQGGAVDVACGGEAFMNEKSRDCSFADLQRRQPFGVDETARIGREVGRGTGTTVAGE